MTDQKPADALAQHWTDRLPAGWKPYARLSRWDRPIGWQLLLLPCWMGLSVARTPYGFERVDALYALLFVIGAIAMRGAGCVYNDILDRDIDAKVARTALRPIPSGQVSLRAAWIWLFLQCLVGLGVLLMLPRFAQYVALASLPLIALYPVMKRITWWPQAWLGIVFNWGVLVGGASAFGELGLEVLVFYVGCVAWTIGYDTIYALQDREDDALVGVRSTARLFGARWRRWTMAFYAIAFVCWLLAAWLGAASRFTYPFLLLVGFGYVYPMLRTIDDAQPGSALSAFKRNAEIGLAVVAAYAAPLLIEAGVHAAGGFFG